MVKGDNASATKKYSVSPESYVGAKGPETIQLPEAPQYVSEATQEALDKLKSKYRSGDLVVTSVSMLEKVFWADPEWAEKHAQDILDNSVFFDHMGYVSLVR